MAFDVGKDAEAARKIYSLVVGAVAKLGGVARIDEIAKYLTENNPDVFTEKDSKRAQSIVQIALYKAVGRKELRYNTDGKYQSRGSTPRSPVYRENRSSDGGDSAKGIAVRYAVAKTPPMVFHGWGKPKAGEGCKEKDMTNNSNNRPGKTPRKQDAGGKGEEKDADSGGSDDEETGEESPKRERIVRRVSEEERIRKARALAKIRAGRTQKPPAKPVVSKNVPLKTKSKMARLATNGLLQSRKPSKYCDDTLSDSSISD